MTAVVKRTYVTRKPISVYKVVRVEAGLYRSRYMPESRARQDGHHTPGTTLYYTPRQMAIAPLDSPGIYFYTSRGRANNSTRITFCRTKILRFTIPVGVRVSVCDDGIILAHVAYCERVR
jgi:hypothetical protein